MCRNERVTQSVRWVADVECVSADDDGVIDVSVTSRYHGDYDDDVREHWRQSSRHHDRGGMLHRDHFGPRLITLVDFEDFDRGYFCRWSKGGHTNLENTEKSGTLRRTWMRQPCNRNRKHMGSSVAEGPRDALCHHFRHFWRCRLLFSALCVCLLSR